MGGAARRYLTVARAALFCGHQDRADLLVPQLSCSVGSVPDLAPRPLLLCLRWARNCSYRSVAGREQPGAGWESSLFCSRGFLSVCTAFFGRATCICPGEALFKGKHLTEELMRWIVRIVWFSFGVPLGSTGCPQALCSPSWAGTLAPPLPQHHHTPLENGRRCFIGCSSVWILLEASAFRAILLKELGLLVGGWGVSRQVLLLGRRQFHVGVGHSG